MLDKIIVEMGVFSFLSSFIFFLDFFKANVNKYAQTN